MTHTTPEKISQFHSALARQTATTSDMGQLLSFILAKTLGLIGAQSGSIMVFDKPSNRLHLHFSAGHPHRGAKGKSISATLPPDEGIAGQVLRTGKPIFVDDLARADPGLPLRRRAKGGSFLSIPLKIHRRTIGVLNLNRSGSQSGFTKADLSLISTIIPHIAGLVEKGRLLEQLKESRNEVQSLYQLSRLLFSGQEFRPSLCRFLAELARYLDLDCASLIRFNPESPDGNAGHESPARHGNRRKDRARGESASDTASETAGESAGETASQTASQTTSRTVDEAAGKTTSDAVSRTVNEAAGKTMSNAVSQTVDEAVDETVDETVDKAIDKAVDRVADEAVDKAENIATGKATGKAAGKAAADFEILAGFRVQKPLLEKMLLSVRSQVLSDLARPGTNGWDDPPSKPPVAFPYREGRSRSPKDMIVISLPISDGPLHALVVSAPRTSADTESAIQKYRFLHLVSKQLAVAIEREAMMALIKADREILLENNLRNSIFLEISKELASTLDPTMVLRKAFDHFGKLISFTTISILMFDELDKTYRILVQPGQRLAPGFKKALFQEILSIFREYPGDPPLADPAGVAIDFFHPQRKEKKPASGYRYVMHLPFILGNTVVGLIHLTRSEEPPFTDKDFEVTSQFTGIFVTSIKNALIHRRTEKLAFTDQLTGLFNHRYFQETLKQEFVRARRYSNPLSLMILDIDFFKRFNDTWGHLLGDRVLAHCGKLFERSVREKIDTVARYGGEEFAVILPETPLSGASFFAERIRHAVEGTPLQAEKGCLPITISIGVACTLTSSCQTPSDLIQAADLALYSAKQAGRNRVHIYEKPSVEHA